MKNEKDTRRIRELLDQAERNLREAKEIFLSQIPEQAGGRKIIFRNPESESFQGVFDGLNMVTSDGKSYPVAGNYISKSKLVCGDQLKLRITEDGSFIFKQIHAVPRKHICGALKKNRDQFYIDHEGHAYNIIQAAITYAKAQVGDKISALAPKDYPADWAAFENIIEKGED